MKLHTRRRAGAVAVAFAMAGAMLVPTQAYAAEPLDTPVALERGHIDMLWTDLNEDGSVRLALSDDATGPHIIRTPESVDIVVKSAAQHTFSATAFVPAELQGQTVYRLPANQNPNLAWPGWDTNSLTSVYGNDVAVDFEVEVDGPGDIWIWQQDVEGEPESQLQNGGYKLTPTATIQQAFPAHTHTNWAFGTAGKYDLAVTAHVSGSGGTAISNTATYSFVVGPTVAVTGAEDSYAEGENIVLDAAVTPVVRAGSYEWSVDGTVVEGQSGSQLTVAAEQNLDGAEVSARFIGDAGTEIAAAEAVTLNIEASAPEQTIAITGLSHHYHQGSPIALAIEADPAAEGGSYEWFVQRVDQDSPVKVDGASGPELALTAEQALDNARVTARLVNADDEALAVAPAVTISIDDHGAAPSQVVTVEGVAAHYHTGDIANLTASVEPASVLTRYAWQVRPAGETEWTTIEGEHGDAHSFEVTEALNGALVRAVLTFDDGAPYVASAPVEIETDDHHSEEPVETTLSITGLAHHYHVGDEANLTAVQNPETGEDHYHWYIKHAGDDDYTVIPGALAANLVYTVTAEDAGAEIIVRLFDHDHGVIAESDPVVIEIDDHGDDDHGDEDQTGDPKPSESPAERTADDLDGIHAGGIELDKTTVTQGGTVTIQVGEGAEFSDEWVAAWMFSQPVLLGGDWQMVAQNGSIVVRIPASATPGIHQIAVFDASGALVGWQNLQVTAAETGETGEGASDSGAKADLAKTGGELPLAAIGGAALLLLAAGGALLLARRRTGTGVGTGTGVEISADTTD